MKIGIIGNGQLARMLMLAGTPMGFEFQTCENHSDNHIICELDSWADVITYENENIPVDLLKKIKKPIHPSISALSEAQDRLSEKKLFNQLKIPTTQYYSIDSFSDLNNVAEHLSFPFVLKSRQGGYDGKNQFIIQNPEDIKKLTVGVSNFIAEEFISFDREISIIGAKNDSGEAVFYDICENRHESGILRKTQNKPGDPLFLEAKNHLLKIMNYFNYVGAITLEFFVKQNQLIANEMAPRVHNSGHWTIEGALTSQFENHIRAIAGLPLGLTTSIGTSTMINCIGEMPDIKEILKTPGAYYHDYLKSPRPGRKLGHITYVSFEEK